MRIITRNNEERIHKCSHCNSVFAYLPEDVNHIYYDSVRCPVCKACEKTSIFDKKVK